MEHLSCTNETTKIVHYHQRFQNKKIGLIKSIEETKQIQNDNNYLRGVRKHFLNKF